MKQSIQEKFGQISYSSDNQGKFAINPLVKMQPYAYLADPNEPVISPDDWEMNQNFEVNDLRSFLILILGFGGITIIQS
ncbi:MAG: hypothetical protein V7K18_08485 [Nostoc sp.]|uniref:hypothetical protein n=1 Tax=Nostoc sp. TaxID=1180 RepID=UPI002FF4FEA6